MKFRKFLMNCVSKWKKEVAQSCPILWDPMDCNLPGSSLHGILQAGILEWVAISFSRGSSQPRDRTQVSCNAGRRFNLWATREALYQSDIQSLKAYLLKSNVVWFKHKENTVGLSFFILLHISENIQLMYILVYIKIYLNQVSIHLFRK